MKADLREIHDAPTRAVAEAAMVVFVEKYGAKYPRAATCLTKDREALLAFYDFPAEHWDHLRSSNPIESVMAASKTWRRLKGKNQLPKVVAGVIFRDGTEVTASPDHRAA